MCLYPLYQPAVTRVDLSPFTSTSRSDGADVMRAAFLCPLKYVVLNLPRTNKYASPNVVRLVLRNGHLQEDLAANCGNDRAPL